MKSNTRNRTPLLITALAATILLSAPTQAKPNKALIRSVRGGAAEISLDGKTWRPAKVGQQLTERSIVKTDPNATVDLFLGDNGPVVRITQDTTLAIDRLNIEHTGIEKIIETQLNLRAGKILGHVMKLAAASKYEIKTPVCEAQIRQGEYSITADGRIQVYSGTIIAIYIINNVPQPPITITAGKQAQLLPHGESSRITDITSSDPNIETLMIGIVRNPDGTWTISREGDPVICCSPPEMIIVLSNDQLPSNYDITNGCISCTQPEEPPIQNPPGEL